MQVVGSYAAAEEYPVLVILATPELRARDAGMRADQDLDADARRLWRAQVVSVECDTQWRFVLRRDLRDYIRVQREVVFVGNGNQIELWNPADWGAFQKAHEPGREATTRDIARRYMQE